MNPARTASRRREGRHGAGLRAAFLAPWLVGAALHAATPPQVIETHPITGATTVRDMRSLEELPPADARDVVRLVDSLRSSLDSSLVAADQVRLPAEPLKPVLRGKAFRGIELRAGGKAGIVVDSLGPADPELSGRLAWALWYVRTWGEQTIQFSLDPEDVQDFSKGNKAVYRPQEALAPYAVGLDLYEADMDLKYYALGYQRGADGGVRPLSNPPPDYRDRTRIAADLFAQGKLPEGGVKARLWIVCDSVFVTESDSAMAIDSVRMRVHARQITPGANNTYVDVGDADPVSRIFAAWFESRYFDLVPRHPELAAVVENAKALAMARWMVARGVAPEARWLQPLMPVADSTVVHGPALVRRDTLRDSGRRKILTLEITGGVELGGGLVRRLGSTRAVRDGWSRAPSSASGSGARPRIAQRVLDETWLPASRKRRVAERDYEVSRLGLPLSAIDPAGRRLDFSTQGRSVVGASSSGKDGTATLTRLPDGGSRLEYRGRTRWIQAEFDAQGRRRELWEYSATVYRS